jgi:hypothetical protein
LLITVRIVVAEHRGQLTTRKAHSATLDWIATDLVKRLRLRGYRITEGLRRGDLSRIAKPPARGTNA